MTVLNIHTRTLNLSKSKVIEILKTLSTENDCIWPNEKWPAMKFKEGIQIGAYGGHGPIQYKVEKYNPSEIIQFRFLKPLGFNGIHKFEINELSSETTGIKHTIDMKTQGKGTFIWVLAILSLHNALIEDAFDKIENKYSEITKLSKWNIWVRIVRFFFTEKKILT